MAHQDQWPKMQVFLFMVGEEIHMLCCSFGVLLYSMGLVYQVSVLSYTSPLIMDSLQMKIQL